MRAVGDMSWHQLSQWDFTPDNCIKSYVKDGLNTFEYKLIRVSEIVTPTHWKVENVLDPSEVSNDLLFSRDREVYVKKNGKSTQIFNQGMK